MEARLPRIRASKTRARREAWPRVGATIENGCIVVRPLEDGESPHPVLKRAVAIAEPCETHRTVKAAMLAAAESLAARIVARGAQVPVLVRV